MEVDVIAGWMNVTSRAGYTVGFVLVVVVGSLVLLGLLGVASGWEEVSESSSDVFIPTLMFPEQG
ncbi:MAG: hypothetical protein ACR2N7_05450 [Acidimicrobiia bacterium]